MLLFSTIFVAILYLMIAFLQEFIFKKLHKNNVALLRLNFIPVVLHGFLLFFYIYLEKNLNLPLLFSLIIGFIVFLTCLGTFDQKSTQAICRVSFPTAALSLLGIYYFHNKAGFIHISNPKEVIHVVLSTLTLSSILLSAIQAGILALQDRSLRRHHRVLTKNLPSMESMENFLFRLIMMSFLLLTSVLISSGFLFTESPSSLFREKILLSFSAWLVFATLLTGRFMFGWRGQTAVRWTFLGTSLLILIYFSSFLINTSI